VVLGFNSSIYTMSNVNTVAGTFNIAGSGNASATTTGGGNGQVWSFGDYSPYAPHQIWGKYLHGLVFHSSFYSDDNMCVSAPPGNGFGWNGSSSTPAMVNSSDDNAGNISLILAPAGTGIIRQMGPSALQTYSVARLPVASAAYRGCMAYVTDATAPVYNTAITGGGAVSVPVFCDGTSWLAH
jgi:hypothetical protein